MPGGGGILERGDIVQGYYVLGGYCPGDIVLEPNEIHITPLRIYFIIQGIHDNEWLPPWKGNKQGITPVTGNASPIPCVFETIKKQEPSAKTAMFYDWDWMRHLGNEAIPGSLDIDRECRWGTERCDVMIAAQASRYLKDVLQSEAKSYTFVYFGNLDEVGHAKKWCSPEFQEEIKITDGLVGRVLDAIDDVNMTSEVLVYLHSDHGGEEGTTQHGTQTDASLLIPFFMRGPGIKKNETFQTEVYIEDIPCTGVHALGLKPSPWWTGRSLLI